MIFSCLHGLLLPVEGALHLPEWSSLYGGSLCAEMGYDQTNFFVRNFGRKRFLERFQAVLSQLLAGDRDLVVSLGRHPAGLKFSVASFDQVGNQGDDGTQRSLANLSNLIERTPLRQQLKRFLGRPRGFRLPIGIRPLPVPEILNRFQDLLPVHLNLLITNAGHAPQLLKIRWFHEAQVLQSGIVQDHERGNPLFLCGVSPPLPQKLIQLSIHRWFSDCTRNSRFRGTCRRWRATASTASLSLLHFAFH